MISYSYATDQRTVPNSALQSDIEQYQQAIPEVF